MIFRSLRVTHARAFSKTPKASAAKKRGLEERSSVNLRDLEPPKKMRKQDRELQLHSMMMSEDQVDD